MHKFHLTMLFPITLMILDLCASFVYLINKDYKHALYWFAAFVLTSCVTF